MNRNEAIDKYIQVIYEWNLPPLNKKDFEEYINSQIKDYFYTPLVWNGEKKKIRNYDN